MKSLVTGADGFLGSSLTAMLAREGFAVRGLVQDDSNTVSLENHGIEVVLGDVRDKEAVSRALHGCEVVYHLAGLTPTPGRSRQDYEEINTLGTENIARAAVKEGIDHFVYCSSVGVYGVPRDYVANESSRRMPLNAYQRSKLRAERIVLKHARRHGLSAVIAQPTAVYGPGGSGALKIFRDIKNGCFRMIGNGSNRHQITHLDDVTKGLFFCGNQTEAAGQRIILASEQVTTVSEYLDTIVDSLAVTGRFRHFPATPFKLLSRIHRMSLARFAPRPAQVDGWDFFISERIFDPARAAKELGFRAQIPIETGIPELVHWYSQHDYL